MEEEPLHGVREHVGGGLGPADVESLRVVDALLGEQVAGALIGDDSAIVCLPMPFAIVTIAQI